MMTPSIDAIGPLHWGVRGDAGAMVGDTERPSDIDVRHAADVRKDALGEHTGFAVQLSELMTRLQSIFHDISQSSLAQTAALQRDIAASTREAALKQAKDMATQLERAQRANTVMRWFGKVLAWIVTIVSVVAAAFTGGASLVVAGLFAAVTVSDQICQAVTGTSFVAKAFDATLSPVVKAVADAISKCLISLGVSEQAAKIVANVLGTLVVVAVVMAAAVVGIRAAVSAIGPWVSQMAKQVSSAALGSAQSVCGAVTRALPEVIQSASTRFSATLIELGEQLMRCLTGQSAQLTTAAIRCGQAATVSQWSLSVYYAATNVTSGVLNQNVAYAEAECEQIKASIGTLDTVLERLFDSAVDVFAASRSVLGIASDMLAQERDVCRNISCGVYRAA